MAHAFSSSSSSSNFQLIFNNALKVYEKRTKMDLLAHPLAAQLQACQSPSTILVILQQQIQDLDQSRNADNRWKKWLDPTVNVLYASGLELVSDVHPDVHFTGIFTSESNICWRWCPPFSAFSGPCLCPAYRNTSIS